MRQRFADGAEGGCGLSPMLIQLKVALRGVA